MSILNFFRSKKKVPTANIAKERLQIIVAHERGQREQPDYLPALRDELLAVIRKYVHIDDDQMNVILDTQENYSVLELNVTLPDR